MRLFLLTLLSLLLGLPLPAEELLPKVQRELRARKFYFGEIHGRATEETVAAVRKFQEARGLDRTGHLDDDTLRALGLPAPGGQSEEARALAEGCTFVLQYLQALESGDWKREAPFYADEVNYYDERHVSRAFIRETRRRENQRWPQRKTTLLQRIASRLPARAGVTQVTARVHTEATAPDGRVLARLEDLLFRIEKTDGGWRITALKLLE